MDAILSILLIFKALASHDGPCLKTWDHKHCWHASSFSYATYPPSHDERCCQCGLVVDVGETWKRQICPYGVEYEGSIIIRKAVP